MLNICDRFLNLPKAVLEKMAEILEATQENRMRDFLPRGASNDEMSSVEELC